MFRVPDSRSDCLLRIRGARGVQNKGRTNTKMTKNLF